MGWKCCLLFVGDVDSGYFGTKPEHSPKKAREILHALGHRVEGISDWSARELFPQSNKVVVGAYEKGAYLAYTKIADDLELGTEDYMRKAMLCYPAGDLLALALHSGVNYSAFAYYKKGELLRRFACAAESGIIAQSGKLLVEEEKAYEGEYERDGQRLFPRKFDFQPEPMEFTIDAVGEEIVFALAARPLGQPLDRAGDECLVTESFTLKPAWKFW